jgi:hypothetical protein
VANDVIVQLATGRGPGALEANKASKALGGDAPFLDEVERDAIRANSPIAKAILDLVRTFGRSDCPDTLQLLNRDR